MRSATLPVLGAAALSLTLIARSSAQEPTATAPSVFYDCNAPYCWDFDHTRREIPYVNWVRDREDADIHVLITALQTGGGGWSYSLEFIGLRANAGRRDTLSYVSDPTDVEDDIRTGLVRVVRLGLVRFLVSTNVGSRLDVTYQQPTEGAVSQGAATADDDPWDFWTFRIGGNGSANGESQQRFYSGSSSLSANRVTDDLKLDFRARLSGSRSEFDYVDSTIPIDTTYVSTRTSYSFDALAVWSLSPQWSAGFRANARRSSTVNQDLSLWAGPAIEYDVYPYTESTRRQITFEYSIGVAAYDYTERTIFNKLSEVLPQHRLNIGIGATQPWGSIGTHVYATQFLHDLTKYNVGVGGSAEIRIVRGLSFNTFGDVARVKDQLYLSSAGLTSDEVLLQQSVRGTDYQFFVMFGLSYRFGSKFSNIVNPRMGGGGGGGITIMM